MLLKEKTEEEMRELSDAVEMATLDKEMAEERVCEHLCQLQFSHPRPSTRILFQL